MNGLMRTSGWAEIANRDVISGTETPCCDYIHSGCFFIKRDDMNNNQKGMTLIELIIVVVIVAILASVALPAWNSQVQKARRADARNLLMSVQIEQEKYRSNYGSYASTMAALGLSAYNSTSRDYYNVSIVSSSATAFVASAAPNTNGGQNSDSCGTFAINQSGPDASGSYASLSDCWN